MNAVFKIPIRITTRLFSKPPAFCYKAPLILPGAFSRAYCQNADNHSAVTMTSTLESPKFTKQVVAAMRAL